MRKPKLSMGSVSTIHGPERHWLQSVKLYAAKSTTPKAVVGTICSEGPLPALVVDRPQRSNPKENPAKAGQLTHNVFQTEVLAECWTTGREYTKFTIRKS